MILKEVRKLVKNRYSNFSESLDLSRILERPFGTESIHVHIHCISSHLLNHFLHPWVSQSNHHSQRWQNSLPFCVDLCLSGHHLTSYFASSTFSCHLWLVLTISFFLVLCFQVVDFSDLKISPCSSFLATDGAFRVFLVFCWHPL